MPEILCIDVCLLIHANTKCSVFRRKKDEGREGNTPKKYFAYTILVSAAIRGFMLTAVAVAVVVF